MRPAFWPFARRTLLTLCATLPIVVVACTRSFDSPFSSSSCPAASPGDSFCGSCGSHCYYCAAGTCPGDPCTTTVCNGRAGCPQTDSAPGHSSWVLCGSCAATATCGYCPAGTCP